MPKMEELKFGSILVDGQKYADIIVADGEVMARDRDKLKDVFGTSHKIGDWEGSTLLECDPEYIIIGDGFNGVLKIQPEVEQMLEKSGTKILVLHSPAAVVKYNELINQGRRVNALIHTTC